jgi:hypothetical protein
MHMDRLPSVEIAGRRGPSTYGLLHEASVQWHGLEFERFAAELGSVDRELRAAYYAEDRELPTLERFKAFGRRVGATEVAMAETLTRTHMAAIRERVTFLAHHAELLARLRRACGSRCAELQPQRDGALRSNEPAARHLIRS